LQSLSPKSEKTNHIAFPNANYKIVTKITIKSKDMKVKFLMISCGLLVLASACNNSETKKTDADTTKAVVATDTAATVAPPPAEMAPAIDSAAITKEYLAARKSTKPTAKPKKQGTNEVVMYSEPPMPTHEALETPPAKKDAPPVVIHTKEYVYYIPDQKASFPGGDAALAAYINKNLVYPEEALRYHVEGTVFAEVYLDSLGNVTNVEVPGTHLGSGLEEETISVLMHSPRWHPAKEGGQMVKSKVTLPVTYKIQH
jgi:outer membrane biosynthesis protein TonB